MPGIELNSNSCQRKTAHPGQNGQKGVNDFYSYREASKCRSTDTGTTQGTFDDCEQCWVPQKVGWVVWASSSATFASQLLELLLLTQRDLGLLQLQA